MIKVHGEYPYDMCSFRTIVKMSQETAYGMLKDLNEREGFKEDLGTCLKFGSSFLNKGFRIITVIYDDVYILYMHDGEFWFMSGDFEPFLS